MIPTIAVRNKAMRLLADDTATLANATANTIRLSMANFAPSENSVIGDFTEATFDGYTAINVTAGPQPEGFDPTTLDSVIDLSPPIGGFRWNTTGVTSLPMQIFGWYLTDSTGAVLLGCQLFQVPVTLTGIGQVVDIGDARLTLLANSIS